MRRRSALAVLLLVAPLVLAACGGGGATVDNDTCPYGPNDPGPYSPNPPDVNSQPPVGEAIPEMPHQHVAEGTKVQYEHDPPTSGCHYSIAGRAPVAPGAYVTEIPAEYWVHNLEHGYIVVLYNCPSGCPGDFQQLRDWLAKQKPDPGLVQFVQQNPGVKFTPYTKVLILPWHTMKPKFAAVSWDWYDPAVDAHGTLDLRELQRFYDNHVGHAPEGLQTP